MVAGLLLGPLERRWNHRQIATVSGLAASFGVLLACMTNNVVQFGVCLVLLTGKPARILFAPDLFYETTQTLEHDNLVTSLVELLIV